ncbi:UbiA prenyltransferase [Methanocaldococcus bathoardescens]|uniref:UbiA prenyltransferase n=1 Tax=Methanocaldococcus bathoardescens TaxID=1301915 RepID=A0A076LAN4_9EURY|nr:hypothetical protein [Methanocaldococcus bathoardescens]AIJ05251.1 UbiA prenyltransferase [Methanocaldococcus bathoardescens]
MKKETKIRVIILMNLILVALTLFALITGRILVTLVGIVCIINGLLALKRAKEE